mmetsp:Transcript_25989/g.49461  ORF Transcript_25989/g.49461 Transcript_25989/m.49461 type:complete len:419 (+) Transcript_25989:215-1471(+)
MADQHQQESSSSSPQQTPSSPPSSSSKHQLDKTLIEPYHYINAVPGKDVRGKLIDCFNLWLNVPTHTHTHNANDNSNSNNAVILNEIKSIVGDLHNASLLIDDIEDNSKLRRGVPVAHSIFGVAPVINTANYVYFLALERCQGLKNEAAMKVFVNEMLNLHRGQGYDIQWRDTTTCPTESQYISMVTDKTGGLFRLAVGLLQSFATTSQDVNFTPLVNNLGLYFQIRDDLINLADEEYMKSKSFCEDLTEGKFSFPIIHCIRSTCCGDGDDIKDGSAVPSSSTQHQQQQQQHKHSSAAAQLLSILKQRTEDVDVKRYAQRLMFDAGSLRYTREKCTSLRKEIVMQIEELGGNDPLLKVIEMLDVQVEKISELEQDGCGGGFRDDGDGSVCKTPVGLKVRRGAGDGKDDHSQKMNLDYT